MKNRKKIIGNISKLAMSLLVCSILIITVIKEGDAKEIGLIGYPDFGSEAFCLPTREDNNSIMLKDMGSRPNLSSNFSNSNYGRCPVVVAPSPQNEANTVRLPDNTLVTYYMIRDKHVASIRSTDNGVTWSEPEIDFEVNGQTGYACRSLVDSYGELHVWYLKRGIDQPGFPGNRQLNIWHNRTTGGRSRWVGQQKVWDGYCGALREAVQMDNGRIIVPFGSWKKGDEDLPDYTGDNYSTVIYSDDGGNTWNTSPSRLTSPVYPNYNGNNYGACEPSMVKLSDGRLWMLMRTQTGVLFESFSNDGINWSEARSTRFTTSNSPAAFVRLDDRRIILLWNNHELPPRVNGQGVYGGRDALHAAITNDDGRTWYGFREIYRDPVRNDTPPRRGDRGTAYPNGVVAADGNVIVITGQAAESRVILRFDPQWLYATKASEDFSSGLNDWNVYKGFGPAIGWWRDRTQGPELVDHPDKVVDKVLHVRNSDEYYPDGATWNFPAGMKGTMRLRIKINAGFGGGQISLADRLFDPTDDQGEQKAIFQLPVTSDGQVCSGELTPGRWYELKLQWDIKRRHCVVIVDNQTVGSLPLKNHSINGVSYLRLRSTAQNRDVEGMLIESVKVDSGW